MADNFGVALDVGSVSMLNRPRLAGDRVKPMVGGWEQQKTRHAE